MARPILPEALVAHCRQPVAICVKEEGKHELDLEQQDKDEGYDVCDS